MHAGRRSIVTIAMVAGLIGAGAAGAAWADDPVSFDSSPVVDEAGVLGARTAEVESALDADAERTGRQLFVAYVDEFENPAAADAWAEQTAIDNGMGAEDYLLAVAVEGRQYYLSAASDASLSDEELDRISLEVIEPELRDEDWAGAAIAGSAAIAGDAGGGGWGTGFIWFLVIAAAIVVIVWIVLARRKKRRVEGGPAGGPPLPSIDDLRRQAGGALVQADDALKTSEEELGFAVASYGDEATADFRAALEGAKAKIAEAFALQQRLDDADPDTDEERRAWYGGIITLAGEADALLDEQAAHFEALRDLERNAPEALARVEAVAATVERGIAPAAQRLAALQTQYAASALAPVADNPAQAQTRMGFAREALNEARAAVGRGEGGPAAVEIRAAEEAVDQAQLLSVAIERLAAELAAADRAVAAGADELDRDVQTARSLESAGTSALAERVAGEASELRRAIAAPGRDPLALQARLEQVDGEIDAAIQGARDAAEQAARTQAQLGRSLQAARSQVQAAEDYLVARRGAVGAEARTRLAEAGRLLVQAEQTAATDAPAALASAQRAEQLARSSMQLAQQDVGGFGGGMPPGQGGTAGGGSGGDLFGAVLGGILINSVLGGGGGGGGGFGGGYSRGGGGGFGGGGRRSPGSFGGSATRSRRGSGGRF